MSAERVIIGGGVIGLSLAWELLLRGDSVWLLDRDRPGHGATWAAGGMLAPVSEAQLEPDLLVALGRHSLERYPDFIARLEQASDVRCAYRSESALWVALDRDDLADLEHLAGTLGPKGLDCREVGAAEIDRLEPHLSSRVLGGLEMSGDHQVDPRAMVAALTRAVEGLGGEIRAGFHVEEVMATAGAVTGVRGRTADGDPFQIACGSVVVAAGAWSTTSIHLPVDCPGLRPVKGQLLRLRGVELLNRVVRTPDVYLVPRCGGELLVGATMEEMGFDLTATAGAAMDLLRHAFEVLPGVYDLELHETCTGLRSAVEDQLPVIGPTEVDGLFLACGHFRNGVLLAPATAHLLAEAIVSGEIGAGLVPFLPSRLDQTVRS